MTSIVLVSEVQLFLPESHSLKHKRAVLSSLKERGVIWIHLFSALLALSVGADDADAGSVRAEDAAV